MELVEINKNNIEDAIKIQNEIFPLEKCDEDLRGTIEGRVPDYYSLQKYWLAKENNKYIGITGLYAYKLYPEDAWLGWFGVLEEERRKGYATKIFKQTMRLAEEKGYKNFRLYTDEIDNANAVVFYEKMGMTREEYNNEKDIKFLVGKLLIFSKSINGKKLTPWNSKYIFLLEHEELNNLK